MSTFKEPMRQADTDRRTEARIGDREREQAVAHLGWAFGEGRLDLAEYDARVTAVYTARTASDLLAPTGDLPLADSVHAETITIGGDELGKDQDHDRDIHMVGDDGEQPSWIWRLWRTYALVITLSVVIWLVVGLTGNGGFPYPWPLWVAGPWGALLLFQTISGMADRRESGEVSR